MMRLCFAASLAVLIATSPSAIAGTIGFDPSEIVIDRAMDDTQFEVDLYVAETLLLSFDAADFIVGSDDGLIVESFGFGPGYCVTDGCWSQ